MTPLRSLRLWPLPLRVTSDGWSGKRGRFGLGARRSGQFLILDLWLGRLWLSWTHRERGER